MSDPRHYPGSNRDTADDTRVGSHRVSTTSAPRWVKVFGIIAIVLILLFVVVVFADVSGPHGPGRHIPSGDAKDDTPPSSVTEEPTPSGGGLGGHTPPEGGP